MRSDRGLRSGERRVLLELMARGPYGTMLCRGGRDVWIPLPERQRQTIMLQSAAIVVAVFALGVAGCTFQQPTMGGMSPPDVPAPTVGPTPTVPEAVPPPRNEPRASPEYETANRVDVPPVRLTCDDYAYPRGADRIVRVDVRLTVLASGHPTEIVAERVHPTPAMTAHDSERAAEAAVHAAAGCRYTPGKLRGRAVSTRVTEAFYLEVTDS